MGDVYMVNGKILSGLPNHAKDIEFDNTGTTLSSTNTEDAIKEVNSNLASNNFGASVDLSPYTTSGSAYEFPLDGYVLISNQASTSGVLTVFIIGKNNSNGALISVEGNAIPDKYSSLFVKKGMRVYILTNTLNSTKTCIFRPVV